MLGMKTEKLMRRLMALTYDKSGPTAWRAAEAIGALAAGHDAYERRDLVQRVLWMMRDESGGNAWSGPEIIGEVLRASHEGIEDLVPVLASFADEPFFLPGVLWALARIAQRKPGMVKQFTGLAVFNLGGPGPAQRAYSALLLGRLSEAQNHRGRIEALLKDRREVAFYEDTVLFKRTVGDLAALALKKPEAHAPGSR